MPATEMNGSARYVRSMTLKRGFFRLAVSTSVGSSRRTEAASTTEMMRQNMAGPPRGLRWLEDTAWLSLWIEGAVHYLEEHGIAGSPNGGPSRTTLSRVAL